MGKTINIMLADNHAVVLAGLKMMIEKNSEYKVVAEVKNGNAALEVLKTNVPVDIILADVDISEIGGLSLAREAKSFNPATKVIILSIDESKCMIYDAFKMGVFGYLLKSIQEDELQFALQHVSKGEKYLCTSLTMQMLEEHLQKSEDDNSTSIFETELSKRELEVLELIADGQTNKEMSDRLFLSKRTIEGHRQTLLHKFKARNTGLLIRCAMRAGVIQ
ncbi:MAG: response regulator transcription factor [Bacteroidota bacterium]